MTIGSTRTTSEVCCEFCGQPLERFEAEVGGQKFPVGFITCECEGARQRELRKREAEEAQVQAARRSCVLSAGIPERFVDEGVDDEQTKTIADALLDGKNVYVVGPVGTGKTRIASKAAKKLVLSSGKLVRMTGFWKVLDAIKASFDGGPDPLPAYQGVGILVLDDIGKESPTDFALERLFALMDERYNRALPTLVTTQYAPSDLARRLASRGDAATAQAIVSRIVGGCVSVELSGEDRRLHVG